jgi:hypothetical protein
MEDHRLEPIQGQARVLPQRGVHQALHQQARLAARALLHPEVTAQMRIRTLRRVRRAVAVTSPISPCVALLP